jgi:hypothetical protein
VENKHIINLDEESLNLRLSSNTVIIIYNAKKKYLHLPKILHIIKLKKIIQMKNDRVC